ncbi:MAG: sensor histidine kinase [Tannerellaceae bacterium]|jgi:signal transduction histidine kinase|nr:sensor histidine kinase [Tannerellaceae bacterium]
MKKLICFTFFLMSTVAAFSQTGVDSLVNLLGSDKLDTEKKLGLLNDICVDYTYVDIDKMKLYAEMGLETARKVNNKYRISMFYEHLGLAYLWTQSYDTSLIYLEKSLEYAIEAKRPDREAYVYSSLANLCEYKNQYTQALEYYLKTLALCDVTGKQRLKVATLANIGGVHRVILNAERSIYFLNQAKELVDGMDYPAASMKIHYDLGSAYVYNKHYEEAIGYFEKILELCAVTENKYYESGALEGLALAYIDWIQDYDKALDYALRALEIEEDFGSDSAIASGWVTLSNIYREMKRYKECEAAAFKILELDSANIDAGRSAYANIAYANIYLGNKERAAHYLTELIEVQLKFTDKSVHDSMSEMEVKYETEKKEMRISALETEQRMYAVLMVAIVAALLSGIGLLFYRHRLAVQKRKLAEQQVKQLEREKELVAALSALNAEKTEREIIARDLHDGVGAMLSVVKNNMHVMRSYPAPEGDYAGQFNKTLDALDKSIAELRRVAHHIMPAMLIERGLSVALDDFCRSSAGVEFYAAESGKRFDTEKELVLYRCAYELVNNAMRHAGAPRIDVHLSMDDKTVYLSVVDNGVGFDPQTASMGMGINNMRTRLASFDGRMDIYSVEGKGTEINIELDL